MVNISELRIGNILHPDEADKTIVASVRAVDENKVSFYEHSPVSPSQATPVNLSDLWLNGYGFTCSGEGKTWTKGSMVLKGSGEGYLFVLGQHTQVVRHVHHLQNLHFALFNENLEVLLPADSAGEEIELAADSIMVNYLPKDKQVSSFSFTLAVEGKNYKVSYSKDKQGYWVFNSYIETGTQA